MQNGRDRKAGATITETHVFNMDWFMNLQLFATMIACLLLFVDTAVVAYGLGMLRLL